MSSDRGASKLSGILKASSITPRITVLRFSWLVELGKASAFISECFFLHQFLKKSLLNLMRQGFVEGIKAMRGIGLLWIHVSSPINKIFTTS
jgi:hypothetical protein